MRGSFLSIINLIYKSVFFFYNTELSQYFGLCLTIFCHIHNNGPGSFSVDFHFARIKWLSGTRQKEVTT